MDDEMKDLEEGAEGDLDSEDVEKDEEIDGSEFDPEDLGLDEEGDM